MNVRRRTGTRLVALLGLVAVLAVSAVIQAQGIITYQRSDNQGPLVFPLFGDRWAQILGLDLELRIRYATLMGEPVFNSNLRYWFWGQEGFDMSSLQLPSISIYRGVDEVWPTNVPLSTLNQAPLANIELWRTDDILVEEELGIFTVYYPFERFLEQVMVTWIEYLAQGGGGGLHVRSFTGVLSTPGEWGWNMPWSTEWDETFPSNFGDWGPRDTRGSQMLPADEAREVFRDVLQDCDRGCRGEVFGISDLSLNLWPVITDIAAHSEAFRNAFYRNPREAMVGTLIGSAALEENPEKRRRRQALAQRALDSFSGEIDPALHEAWHRQQAAARRDNDVLRPVRSAAETAVCEFFTDGQASPETLASLEAAEDSSSLSEDIREKIRDARQLLSGENLGTGDVQVTLRWDDGEDLDLYVTEPGGDTISYNNTSGRQGGELDVDDTDGYGPENVFWEEGGAPTGEYEVRINHYSGGTTDYSLRILAGGTVTEHTGTVSSSSDDLYRFHFDGGVGHAGAADGDCLPLTASLP